ncbi:MAG: dTDP-4-dehydrorhamnose reductase [Thermodesulfobacteriota bacterium]
MVLGAAGMLGTDVVRVLATAHQVLPRTRNDWDITDPEACRADITAIKPDVVINCAAFTKVDDCESQPDKAFSVNGEAVKHIATACQAVKSRLIQISTDYVFDGAKGAPYREEDTPNPINVYGQSKLKGEEYALKIKGSLVIRTSWLYGRNGPNFVDTILRLAKEKKSLTVVDDQFGSPTYTSDLAGAIARLVQKELTGIIHITNSGICSWYDFAWEILKIAGEKDISIAAIKTTGLNRPAKRPHFSALDNNRYISVTGQPLRPWPEALAEYLGSIQLL